MKNRQKVLAIVGPTASGKSSLAVELAKRFNGEVISADSRQVYRGLTIGTGKITKKEMRGVPHHLLDIASPKRPVTAHEFAAKGRAAIQDIAARGHLPIIVGGTGFYIDALLHRIQLPDVAPNKKLRAALQKKTTVQLYALLRKRDPRRAKAMNTPSERNNKVRLIRALEIASSKGSPRTPQGKPAYDALWLGISWPQKQLEHRIRSRLHARIEQGMLNEGKHLHAHGLSYKRMEELGLEYRSLSNLLQNKITRQEFENELYRDIRRYAKKQVAYWKRNPDIRWYSARQTKRMQRDIAAWLKVR